MSVQTENCLQSKKSIPYKITGVFSNKCSCENMETKECLSIANHVYHVLLAPCQDTLNCPFCYYRTYLLAHVDITLHKLDDSYFSH